MAANGEAGLNTIADNGDTLQMLAMVSPVNATDKTIAWSVSDTTVAFISSNGLLTAKNNGTITVIATANDGSDVQGKLQIIIGQVKDGVNLKKK
ncbi:MAG: Ig-like domain-containing protein [Bacteroidales bacterium]